MSNIATFDQALATVAKLLRLLRQEGLSEEALHWPIDDKIFRRKLTEFWERKGNLIVSITTERYTVTVNYAGNKTIKNLLKEGKYDWVNSNITDKNFPTDKTGEEENEIHLVHLDRLFDNGDLVIEELDKLGYKPANPAQLLALGIKHPDLQRQFPIAALGQHWFDSDVRRHVVYLDGSFGDRDASLDWLEDRWRDDWRFAVVRK